MVDLSFLSQVNISDLNGDKQAKRGLQGASEEKKLNVFIHDSGNPLDTGLRFACWAARTSTAVVTTVVIAAAIRDGVVVISP